jgi:hypothetical protein
VALARRWFFELAPWLSLSCTASSVWVTAVDHADDKRERKKKKKEDMQIKISKHTLICEIWRNIKRKEKIFMNWVGEKKMKNWNVLRVWSSNFF